jgi:hypothetical protein
VTGGTDILSVPFLFVTKLFRCVDSDEEGLKQKVFKLKTFYFSQKQNQTFPGNLFQKNYEKNSKIICR